MLEHQLWLWCASNLMLLDNFIFKPREYILYVVLSTEKNRLESFRFKKRAQLTDFKINSHGENNSWRQGGVHVVFLETKKWFAIAYLWNASPTSQSSLLSSALRGGIKKLVIWRAAWRILHCYWSSWEIKGVVLRTGKSFPSFGK